MRGKELDVDIGNSELNTVAATLKILGKTSP